MGERQNSYPLSSMQQGMVFHSRYAPQSGVYVQQLICDLKEALDISTFQFAWQRVVERHSVFRTSFHWDGPEPYQKVHRTVRLPFEFEDLSSTPVGRQEILLKDFLRADRRQGFQHTQAPLTRMKLFQFAQAEYKLVWTSHHALLDGRARFLTLCELFNVYEAFSQGKDLNLDQPPAYQDYFDWLKIRDMTTEEGFWRHSLKGFSAPTPLVVDRNTSAVEGAEEEHRTQSIQLSEISTSGLQALAQPYEFTLNTVVLGAWALLLSRYCGEQDVLFGVTRTGCPSALKGAESIIGLLINTVPIRVQITPDKKVLPWLKELRATWLAIGDYQYTPLVQIQGWSDVPPGSPLFETLVVFEYEDLNTMLRAQGERWENRHVQLLQQTNYPLTVGVCGGTRLFLEIGYDRHRFDTATISRMLGHLQVLLEGIANHPEQCLSQLPLLTPAESQQVLVVWNNTMRDYEHVPCIHQRVESQVRRTPDAVAVTCEEEALTYRELNQRANQLARYLRRLGVGPEVLVGLCMEPSLEMVIGLLGILKSGGAYVPLDPTYPADRLALMIEDAHVSVLLTQEDLVETLPDSTDVRQVCLYKHRGVIDQETDENLENWTMPENLAYVMYTSGSTGRPKGVMISHRGIGNRLQWGQETYQLTDTDRVLQKDSVSFDTSVWKFFGPLFVGAQLVVAPPGARQDPAWLVTLVTQHQITTTGWTASALQVFLEEKGNNPCHSLRQVLCGGEALSLKVQERFFACLNGKLHNLYGPTEVSIDVTCWECNPSRSPHTIPIGRPIANTQAYLLDGHVNPVPIGVPGELYFGGTGLARGYFNGPDLTAERFVPNLYSDQPGARLYRTGDIARYLSDGNLEFLGRRDYQVKLRGYRIELGEIETALIQHPAVWEAVVLLCEDRLGEKRLVAYVVRGKETPLSIATLRNFLHMTLPDYMIPSALVFLDALPLTTHGKVNRQALPLPDEKSVSSAEQFVAPKTPIESHLATLWEEVLNIKRVGIYDNFFALGGHSLLAFKLISRIRHDLEVELPIRALFYNPTIAGLVRIITEQEDP